MMAKQAMWRLKNPLLTSEHLLYACLRLHDQRHWELCRNLPVTAETVWNHLKQNPPSEESEDFSGVRLGVSAKTALERAETDAAQHGDSITGSGNLMRALLSESSGPVRALLSTSGATKSEASSLSP
jgi:ATP-dependent Clp protease ATP-binding subunit ClpA